jgi:hypothetical protein
MDRKGTQVQQPPVNPYSCSVTCIVLRVDASAALSAGDREGDGRGHKAELQAKPHDQSVARGLHIVSFTSCACGISRPSSPPGVFRPSTGEHTNLCNYILSRYTKVPKKHAQPVWEAIYKVCRCCVLLLPTRYCLRARPGGRQTTASTCMHGEKCKVGAACEAGKRVRASARPPLGCCLWTAA